MPIFSDLVIVLMIGALLFSTGLLIWWKKISRWVSAFFSEKLRQLKLDNDLKEQQLKEQQFKAKQRQE